LTSTNAWSTAYLAHGSFRITLGPETLFCGSGLTLITGAAATKGADRFFAAIGAD